VKVYVELPGVEKEDIKLNFGKGCIEVRARNFYKTIELPNSQVCMKNPATQYRNGVLEITLQKNKKLREEDAKSLKIV